MPCESYWYNFARYYGATEAEAEAVANEAARVDCDTPDPERWPDLLPAA